jgi:alkanesulfonate monooxygenase SsuD/methylene tetrahydromethanopterin reductase-like flavin-dependent oxidoreductase (luciferase family)
MSPRLARRRRPVAVAAEAAALHLAVGGRVTVSMGPKWGQTTGLGAPGRPIREYKAVLTS